MVIDEVIARNIDNKRKPSKNSKRVIVFPIGNGRVIRYEASERGIFIRDNHRALQRPSVNVLPEAKLPYAKPEAAKKPSDMYSEWQM